MGIDTSASAIVWTERAIALAIVLQTLELLQVRRVFSDAGIWRWSIVQRDHAALPKPVRLVLRALLPYRPFVALLIVRLAAAGLLLAGHSFALPLLLLSQLAICIRFGGTYNGGSDCMTVLILLALSVALGPALARAALAYIAVQVTLSYVIAGLVKLRQPEWRSGQALRTLLASADYGAPAWVASLSTPIAARISSSAVIAFECTVVLAWTHPLACTAWLGLGLGFHLVNAVVFGLNRFLFAWAAGYPAMLFCSQLLHATR